MKKVNWWLRWGFLIVGLVLLVAAVCGPFRALGIRSDLDTKTGLSFLAAILFVALVVERATALFESLWLKSITAETQARVDTLEQKNKEKPSKQTQTDLDAACVDLAKEVAAVESVRPRMAWAVGILASAAGFRILHYLIDAATYDGIPHCQKEFFVGADVFLTGTLLAGGAEPIKELIKTFKEALGVLQRHLRKRPQTDEKKP